LPSVVEEELNLEPRKFSGAIDRSWGNASFSRLISGREDDPLDEGPLLEPLPNEEIAAANPPTGIHDFPKGMRAGTCLHEILEEVNFADLSGAPEIVHRRLHVYGISGRDEAVLENLRSLTTLPLTGAADSFSLQEVPNESRLAELEFSFSVNGLTKEKLERVFQLPEIELHLERLQFHRLNGFMNGFIDLVFEHNGRFYFADWKSNWLGPDTSVYTPSAVAAEMQRHFYTLQLSLYSVALHRYLRVRKPGYDFGRHFGGAFYIFLRGIDLARPENGIYFKRPSEAFVERLSGIFER
jgi:exodeoxyribonuclease V beta subunit